VSWARRAARRRFRPRWASRSSAGRRPSRTATYDEHYGFPTSVQYDDDQETIDDEGGFRVVDFVPRYGPDGLG
jgi:hypothetical protein